MSSKWVATLATVTALLGCGDAAPPEVAARGAALLTLHGTLPTTISTLSTSLIPALGFTPYITNWGHKSFVVGGELEGSFPGTFIMRVYDPPPEDALITMTKGEPPLAMGGITAVMPNHPRWLEWTSDADGNAKVCSDAGECAVPQTQDCTYLNEGPSNCLTTVVPGKNWGDHGYAQNYLVLFLASPAPAGGVYSTFFAGGAEIPAGYSLVRYEQVASQLAQSDRVAYAACQTRATGVALEGFNADHGTSYSDYTMISNGGEERDVQLLADWDGTMLAATVHGGCVVPGAQRLLAPSSTDMIDVALDTWSDL
jgi:hypothetical protein